MKRYPIKECFLSLQGEGLRAGEASVFLRFAGCNLKCKKETHGFDCDTDFAGGEALDLEGVGRLPDRFPEQLADLRAAGFRLLVLLVGGDDEPVLPPDIHWRRIRQAGDLAGASLP